MCYSIVRYKTKDGQTQYAEAKAEINEGAILKAKREDSMVSQIEVFRFHDGEKRVEYWENLKANEQKAA